MKNSHFFFFKNCDILKLGGSMAKYSLWISDKYLNRFYVPLSRDGKNYKEKNELYEIDLLTVSLGKEDFIECLKKSSIAPNQFDWNSVYGYIQYQMNHETCYLPLLFVEENIVDSVLIQVLNFQNEHRYHQHQNETQILHSFQKRPMTKEFTKILFSLRIYRDYILDKVKNNQDMLSDGNLSIKLIQKIYSCIQSNDYDEQIEYKNDILLEMLSYINFRRLKTTEYGCHIKPALVNRHHIEPFVEDSNGRDSDDEFLTDDEKELMYG